MMKVFDANKECGFTGRQFFFDTNVWLAIFGGDIRKDRRVYSNYLKSIIEKGNEVVVSDCILSEYFNRAGKLEYELMYQDNDYKQFKARRVTKEFVERLESVRDTCLDILDETSECISAYLKDKFCGAMDEAATGKIDLTDALIVDLCKAKNFILVTHDFDFNGYDLEIVTANSKYLSSR